MDNKTGYTLEEFSKLINESIDISVDSLKHNKDGLDVLLFNCIVKFGYETRGEVKKVVLCSNLPFITTYFKGIGISTADMNSRCTKLKKAKLSCSNDKNKVAAMNMALCHYGTFPLEKWWVEDFITLESKNAEKINDFLLSINKNWKLLKENKK